MRSACPPADPAHASANSPTSARASTKKLAKNGSHDGRSPRGRAWFSSSPSDLKTRGPNCTWRLCLTRRGGARRAPARRRRSGCAAHPRRRPAVAHTPWQSDWVGCTLSLATQFGAVVFRRRYPKPNTPSAVKRLVVGSHVGQPVADWHANGVLLWMPSDARRCVAGAASAAPRAEPRVLVCSVAPRRATTSTSPSWCGAGVPSP